MLLSRCLLSMFLLLSAEVAVAGNLPLPNPFLADSHNAMAHNDPAQQDAVSLAGPSGPSRRLSPEEIQYLHTGPAHFGQVVSGVYPDGRRVFWGNGIDRIVKVDYDTYELVGVVVDFNYPIDAISPEDSSTIRINTRDHLTEVRGSRV